ncbi:MAG: hypothetical protein JO052_02960 [Bradyrhizobium sp.]|nr:hypothetical protein [Bradyrhizobium sp.]
MIAARDALETNDLGATEPQQTARHHASRNPGADNDDPHPASALLL